MPAAVAAAAPAAMRAAAILPPAARRAPRRAGWRQPALAVAATATWTTTFRSEPPVWRHRDRQRRARRKAAPSVLLTRAVRWVRRDHELRTTAQCAVANPAARLCGD